MNQLNMSMGKWVVENKITKGVESNCLYTHRKQKAQTIKHVILYIEGCEKRKLCTYEGISMIN